MPPKKSKAASKKAPKKTLEDVTQQYKPIENQLKNKICELNQKIRDVSKDLLQASVDADIAAENELRLRARQEIQQKLFLSREEELKNEYNELQEKLEEIRKDAYAKDEFISKLIKERDEVMQRVNEKNAELSLLEEIETIQAKNRLNESILNYSSRIAVSSRGEQGVSATEAVVKAADCFASNGSLNSILSGESFSSLENNEPRFTEKPLARTSVSKRLPFSIRERWNSGRSAVSESPLKLCYLRKNAVSTKDKFPEGETQVDKLVVSLVDKCGFALVSVIDSIHDFRTEVEGLLYSSSSQILFFVCDAYIRPEGKAGAQSRTPLDYYLKFVSKVGSSNETFSEDCEGDDSPDETTESVIQLSDICRRVFMNGDPRTVEVCLLVETQLSSIDSALVDSHLLAPPFAIFISREQFFRSRTVVADPLGNNPVILRYLSRSPFYVRLAECIGTLASMHFKYVVKKEELTGLRQPYSTFSTYALAAALEFAIRNCNGTEPNLPPLSSPQLFRLVSRLARGGMYTATGGLPPVRPPSTNICSPAATRVADQERMIKPCSGCPHLVQILSPGSIYQACFHCRANFKSDFCDWRYLRELNSNLPRALWINPARAVYDSIQREKSVGNYSGNLIVTRIRFSLLPAVNKKEALVYLRRAVSVRMAELGLLAGCHTSSVFLNTTVAENEESSNSSSAEFPDFDVELDCPLDEQLENDIGVAEYCDNSVETKPYPGFIVAYLSGETKYVVRAATRDGERNAAVEAAERSAQKVETCAKFSDKTDFSGLGNSEQISALLVKAKELAEPSNGLAPSTASRVVVKISKMTNSPSSSFKAYPVNAEILSSSDAGDSLARQYGVLLYINGLNQKAERDKFFAELRNFCREEINCPPPRFLLYGITATTHNAIVANILKGILAEDLYAKVDD